MTIVTSNIAIRGESLMGGTTPNEASELRVGAQEKHGARRPG